LITRVLFSVESSYSIRLFPLLPAQDALVDRLAALEAFFLAMPKPDLLFSQLPAEKHDLFPHDAGKIQQAYIEVFDLHADRVDLGKRVLRVLKDLVALVAASGEGGNIERHASAHQSSLTQRLKLICDRLDLFLAVHGPR